MRKDGLNSFPAFALRKACVAIYFLVLGCLGVKAQTTIIPYGSSWKFLDNGSDQGTAWSGTGFNDAGWASGNGELGYGDGDEVTLIDDGACATYPCATKYITTYFRKVINIPNPSVYGSFTLTVLVDDGAIVYLNGNEIGGANNGRVNMPTGAVTFSTQASTAGEELTQNFTISPGSFVAGNNTIAVEVHQANNTSSDVSFNLELKGNNGFTAALVRDAYLQVGNENAVTIRWRTSTAQNSKVEIGTSFGSYPVVVNDAALTTEHIVRVTGLTADTKYWYRIGNSAESEPDDVEKFFTTLPPANTTRKIRVAAFGDCGRGDATYQDENLTNYRSYLTANGIDAPDAWLLLGDNAYNSGTDAEYNTKFFGIYGSNILKNHKLYPAPGNHDYYSGTRTARNLPYHQHFSVPQNAECGGVASNKQNYYSFNIGNIHFLSLDSYGIESDGTNMETAGGSALKTWLDADLAANSSKWIIAYWHHAPYTKSSHNSDTELDLERIRQNFIGYLESKGVDLIINGHSHAYERGYLIRNYTGNWASFNISDNTKVLSTSSATYTSNATCPYVYNTSTSNHGTVYVVTGSAGASGGTNTGFAAGPMPYAVNDAGIFYFEVEDNRLDAKLLRRNGTVFDRFTIMKDVNRIQSQSITTGQSVTLNASWPGTYAWSNAATTRSISVTPPEGTTTYTCTDAFGCVTDQYSVTAINGVLNVRLKNFEARRKGNTVQLNWTSLSEQGSKRFDVQRSHGSNSFQTIGTLIAAGQTQQERQYSFTDAQAPNTVAYYRLAMVDSRDKVNFSDVRQVAPLAAGAALKLSPATGGIRYQLEWPGGGEVVVQIVDLKGSVVFSKKVNAGAGQYNGLCALPKGGYVFLVNGKAHASVQQKFTVQ